MEPNDYAGDTAEGEATLGRIEVNNAVVASIVRLAALQVKGVCGVGAGLVDNIADMVSWKRESDRGVKVFDDDTNSYSIELRIVVAFGTEIAKVAYQVQTLVREQVEKMTGNRVKRVDVFIEGVKVVEDKASPRPAEDDSELWRETPHTD
jgi:uncharacterized alkaline shock family protein YloU